MDYHNVELSNDPIQLIHLLHITTDNRRRRSSASIETTSSDIDIRNIDISNIDITNNNSNSENDDMSTSTSPTIGATLTCNCGGTVLRFDTRVPRAVTECCCDDCYDRLQYCARLGGPALERGVYDRTRPVRLVYFDNRLSVLKGRDHLRFFKLTPSSGVVNMYSSCCHTFLLKENVRYQGAVVAAIEQDYGNDDNADLALEDHQPRPVHHRHNLQHVEHRDAMLRTFPNDWLLEHVSYLKPLPSVWFDEAGNVVGQPKGSWEDTFDDYMDKVTAKIPPMMAGVEFGVLMGEDHDVEIVSDKVFTDAGAVGEDTKMALAQ